MYFNELYDRVSAWNNARYDRVFNLELLVELLTEEFDETVAATTAVNQLDGRCDQIYVAIGGMWKLNLPEALLEQAFGEAGLVVAGASEAGYLHNDGINAGIKANILSLSNHNLPQTDMLKATILATICLLNVYAIERDFDISAYDAMIIVCDANDSKAVQKVAPDVKANIDKGESFVPPEARLQALLDEVSANVKH